MRTKKKPKIISAHCGIVGVSLVSGGVGGAGGRIVSVRELVPVPPALEAESVIVLVPGEAGEPLMSPEFVSRERPLGRADAAKLVGLLEAVIW